MSSANVKFENPGVLAPPPDAHGSRFHIAGYFVK